ncbi:hypothetical protein [Bacillus pumilus]|uniref:hypothetical protein n=1 Tax=Bacillus pumilus TaxID=1408 RepID=UPI001642AABB|nr:hypothetical protein [Bacillus pumilus]
MAVNKSLPVNNTPGYIVRRINIDNFQVIKEGTVVFEGEDYEVVEYVNGGQE